MRIGEFADRYSITQDAVRHYIEIGLLFPVKSSSGYYQFEDDCQKSLERIIELKRMRFSLDEIKKILSYEILAGEELYRENSSYIDIFRRKKNQIDEDIAMLVQAQDMLSQACMPDAFEDGGCVNDVFNGSFGMNIKHMHLLACPDCNDSFDIKKAEISDNVLTAAELSCSCGYSMRIEDGIIIADEGLLELSEDPLDIGSYIDNTHPEFIQNIQRSISWFKNEMDFESFKGKTILELGSGSGFFLRSLYENLPEDCLYIAVDNNINRHYELKKMLENHRISKNIIFICCDFMQIPIKKTSADIVLDFSGSTNYAFNNEDFLINKIGDVFSPEAVLFGSYFVFENFKANSLIEDGYKKHFMKKNILKNLKDASFCLMNSHESEQLTQGGIYENFFVEGERVRSFYIMESADNILNKLMIRMLIKREIQIIIEKINYRNEFKALGIPDAFLMCIYKALRARSDL